MIISGNEKLDLYQALTRYNYFPNQKGSSRDDKGDGELPPCINTRQFTPDICDLIVQDDGYRIKPPQEEGGENRAEGSYGRTSGYNVIEYKATRFNNMPRTLSLVHPKAYSLLAKHIHDHWNEIKQIQESECSQIVPKQSHDGRIMVMNYGHHEDQQETFRSSFGMLFKVTADISNCFNSIYSHAIPWAIVGVSKAKNCRKDNLWYNRLDAFQRKCKRNETQGIPIGPATSNIVVEIILQKVDEQLVSKGFQFKRYIDDYQCFCPSHEKAQEFILYLGQALSVYKLNLNLHKTYITALPIPSQDDWVIELQSALPNRFAKPEGVEQKFHSVEAITFLNRAIQLNERSSDGSILKYAIRLIINDIDAVTAIQLLDPIINLAWHYPTIIPFIATLFKKISAEENIEIPEIHFEQLDLIIIENAQKFRSDGMSWPLHILRMNNRKVSDNVINAVLRSEDCVSITILYSMLDNKAPIIEFVNDSILGTDDYGKDSYWLLLYQMFLFDDLTDGYCNDKVFSILKSHNVNFMPDQTQSTSENEWDAKMVSAMFDFAL